MRMLWEETDIKYYYNAADISIVVCVFLRLQKIDGSILPEDRQEHSQSQTFLETTNTVG